MEQSQSRQALLFLHILATWDISHSLMCNLSQPSAFRQSYYIEQLRRAQDSPRMSIHEGYHYGRHYQAEAQTHLHKSEQEMELVTMI
jgi:hypothetical protein